MDNIKFKQLGSILLLVGLVLVGLTLNAKRHEGTLFEPTQEADGQVIDRFTTEGSGAGPELRLRVEFAPAGSKRVIETQVDEPFWQSHAKGSRVAVIWHRSKIDKARLVGASNDELMFWIKVIGGGVAMLLGLVVLGYDRWRT